jgi:hypothetical protein
VSRSAQHSGCAYWAIRDEKGQFVYFEWEDEAKREEAKQKMIIAQNIRNNQASNSNSSYGTHADSTLVIMSQLTNVAMDFKRLEDTVKKELKEMKAMLNSRPNTMPLSQLYCDETIDVADSTDDEGAVEGGTNKDDEDIEIEELPAPPNKKPKKFF